MLSFHARLKVFVADRRSEENASPKTGMPQSVVID